MQLFKMFGKKPKDKFKTIRVSDSVSQLTCVGEEYLTDKNGNIIGIFFDGNLRGHVAQVNGEEPTAVMEHDGPAC